jgi:hypothetical protein
VAEVVDIDVCGELGAVVSCFLDTDAGELGAELHEGRTAVRATIAPMASRG